MKWEINLCEAGRGVRSSSISQGLQWLQGGLLMQYSMPEDTLEAAQGCLPVSACSNCSHNEQEQQAMNVDESQDGYEQVPN